MKISRTQALVIALGLLLLGIAAARADTSAPGPDRGSITGTAEAAGAIVRGSALADREAAGRMLSRRMGTPAL